MRPCMLLISPRPAPASGVEFNYLPSRNTRFYTVDVGQAVPIYVHNNDPARLAFR